MKTDAIRKLIARAGEDWDDSEGLAIFSEAIDELEALETATAVKDEALRVGIETARRFDIVSGAAFATNPQGSRAYEAVCALRGWANPSFGKAQVALSSEPAVKVVARADEAVRRETVEECVSFIVGNTPFEGCNGCVARLIGGIRAIADRDATQEAMNRIGGG